MPHVAAGNAQPSAESEAGNRMLDGVEDSNLSPLSPDVFRAVVDASPHGAIVVDAAGRVAYVNQQAERVLGRARAGVLGSPVEAVLPLHAPGLAGGPSGVGAAPRLGGLDGAGASLDVRRVPMDGGGYDIFFVASASRDPVDARFRTAVEASPHGMLMIDPDGRVVLVNREIERMFGYGREEILGQSVELLVPLSQRGHHPELREGFTADPHSRPMGAGRDLHARRKDGVEFPVEIGLNPIRTDGRVSVLASVVDIGPRKRAEEELRRSNHELEQFAYVASHDLQEPLRTVASFVQLLARRYRDRLDTDAMEFIDFAVGGVTRMQRLIEDLLRFSRVGTQGAPLAAVDSEAVVRTVIENLRAAIDESGATIETGRLPRVLADPRQVEQLLTNLVGNAIKFRGAEPPRVRLDAHEDGRRWRFTVSDNGIGIEPQYFDRIFVIFQRLHGRDDYPGTGVGLAICKKIVERHGGRIWVESAPGAGATFIFTLPALPE
jgi:PAS domain S-box-containing protein